MKIVVFGANGHVGQLVVEELVSRGYEVRACIHGGPRRKLDGVEYVQGDIYRKKEVADALRQAGAVISCLGSWGTQNKDILATGMTNIIPAMQDQGISRIISLTGADAHVPSEKWSVWRILTHALFGAIAGKILRDGERHVELLSSSHLHWTVLRSPVMNEKGSTSYTLVRKYPMPWRTIHRQAVAMAMCDQLNDSSYIGQSPFLRRA